VHVYVCVCTGTRPSAHLLLGALGVMLNIEAIFAMCWVGFMVALSIKVGQEIGAGRARMARAYVRYVLVSKETYNRPKETYSYAKRDLQTHRQSGMRVFVGLLASRLYIPISIGLFSLITRPL